MHRQRNKKGLPMDMEYDTRFRSLKIELDINNEFDSKESWAKTLKLLFGDYCSICGWKETTCDSHHIIFTKNKGKNVIQNGIILCPNHHRMVHKKLISQEYLLELNRKKIESIKLVEPVTEII